MIITAKEREEIEIDFKQNDFTLKDLSNKLGSYKDFSDWNINDIDLLFEPVDNCTLYVELEREVQREETQMEKELRELMKQLNEITPKIIYTYTDKKGKKIELDLNVNLPFTEKHRIKKELIKQGLYIDGML